MNTSAKGSRYEAKCMNELLHYPYRWKTFRSRFQNLDFFKIGDIVVSNGREIRIIQVKFGKIRDAYEEMRKVKFAKEVKIIKEVWVWKVKKKFKGWEKWVVP